jgi:hypothetical protein
MGAIVIASLMAFLIFGSNSQCQSCKTELCNDLAQCNLAPICASVPEAGKEPTLAPPRIGDPVSAADNSLRAPSLGQSVYVQIKTDHSDIEVGWASGELMGR